MPSNAAKIRKLRKRIELLEDCIINLADGKDVPTQYANILRFNKLMGEKDE